VRIREFQRLIRRLYYHKDKERGIDGSFRWLVEEIGELAKCLRQKRKDKEALKEEFADTFAWLVSLASLCGIDMEEVIKKYENGCPRCKKKRCICPD